MTKRKPPPPKLGRYNIDEITARVERERIRHGYEIKEFADGIGLTKWTYYKRADLSHPFSVEELGCCADFLKAPPFWPFAEWSMLEGLFPERGR